MVERLGQAQPPPQVAAAGTETAVAPEGDERPVDGRVGRRAQQLPRRIGPLGRTAAATRRQAARNTAASCSRVNSGRPSADDESPGSTDEQSIVFPPDLPDFRNSLAEIGAVTAKVPSF